MYPHYIRFSQVADNARIAPLDRSLVLAGAIATAISRTLALPSTEVDSPENYYAVQLQMGVNRQVAELNENLPFDRKACQEFIRSLWLVRYGAAHPGSLVRYGTEWSFFDLYTNAANVVPAETFLFFNSHKDAVLALARDAAELLVAVGTTQ